VLLLNPPQFRTIGPHFPSTVPVNVSYTPISRTRHPRSTTVSTTITLASTHLSHYRMFVAILNDIFPELSVTQCQSKVANSIDAQ
jgi:hypothetical protein